MQTSLSFLLKAGVFCFTALLLWLPLPAAAGRGGPWGAGAEVSAISDDNVTRAQATGAVKKDTATQLQADVYYSFDFSLNRSLIVSGHVLDESYSDFDGISSVQAGLGLEYRFRTHAGFSAPIYSFYINDTQADYETDNRDGDTLEYGLRARRQYTDRIALAAGAAQSERTAEGRVFDLEQARYFAQLDYEVPNLFQAYLAYHYIDGDVYSISPLAPASYGGGSDFYEATEFDPAFSAPGRPWWAYRLDARTDILRFGFNVAFNGNNAIDISVDDIGSETKNPAVYDSGTPGYSGRDRRSSNLTYDATVIAATYFHRF